MYNKLGVFSVRYRTRVGPAFVCRENCLSRWFTGSVDTQPRNSTDVSILEQTGDFWIGTLV